MAKNTYFKLDILTEIAGCTLRVSFIMKMISQRGKERDITQAGDIGTRANKLIGTDSVLECWEEKGYLDVCKQKRRVYSM